MTAIAQEWEGDGHARYTCRLRVSSGARTALEAEWSRCRWLWNECCARSKKAHRDGEKCGPARLDRMLTEARTAMLWLREGSSVPQQQLIRDFAKSRAKALKDIKARFPMRQRAGMPRYKEKHQDAPSLNCTRRGFRLKSGRLHLAGGIAVTVVWSRDLPEPPSSVHVYREGTGAWYASFVVLAVPADSLRLGRWLHCGRIPASQSAMARKAADAAIGATKAALVEMARKHGRTAHLVHPARTTMDCAQCGARTKHALPLSERTYTCTACGVVSPRDKNSARVMLVRAGLQPG
ncbi:transposase [Streptomyces mirabilis]|uniref:RNA-guided endonuclease InsQ/TnpB family protein n=1 Tax=Streptomyces mirabilis TaxID=68239 RepID=UPI00225B137B|nr:transposase [Streptomyces mirabilis]MCX5354887.1 transposase [Streptomyces mirabilis]